MTDRPPGAGGDSGASYERESARQIPRWVKVLGIALAVLILLVVIVMILLPGGGDGDGHGPGRHGMSLVVSHGWSGGP